MEDSAARLDLVRALSLLQPVDGIGLQKCRVGNVFDGGYVISDDLSPVHAVYSFGIGGEVSFDLAIAEVGIPVFQFDHTVDGPPTPNPMFHFSKAGLGSVDDPASAIYTLEHHLRAGNHIGRTDLLLKVDIEGAEFAAIAAAGPGLMRSFRQIVAEIHWLHRLADPAYRAEFSQAMRCLLDGFHLVHVHGNNCCPVVVVGGLPVADVLELTFVRKDLCSGTPSQTVYPTCLDYPNNHLQPDLLLWFFPFLPVGQTPAVSAVSASLRATTVSECEQREHLVRVTIAAHQTPCTSCRSSWLLWSSNVQRSMSISKHCVRRKSGSRVLKRQLKIGFEQACSFQERRLTPTAFAMARPVQCVTCPGGSEQVSARIFATVAVTSFAVPGGRGFVAQ